MERKKRHDELELDLTLLTKQQSELQQLLNQVDERVKQAKIKFENNKQFEKYAQLIDPYLSPNLANIVVSYLSIFICCENCERLYLGLKCYHCELGSTRIVYTIDDYQFRKQSRLQIRATKAEDLDYLNSLRAHYNILESEHQNLKNGIFEVNCFSGIRKHGQNISPAEAIKMFDAKIYLYFTIQSPPPDALLDGNDDRNKPTITHTFCHAFF